MQIKAFCPPDISRASKVYFILFQWERKLLVLTWIYKTDQLAKPSDVKWYSAIYECQIMK